MLHGHQNAMIQAPPITKKEAAIIIHELPKDVKKSMFAYLLIILIYLIVRTILISN